MPDLRAAKVLVLAALAMVLLLSTHFSTAAFTSSSSSTATVRAASDWTPPRVALDLLPPLVRGDVVVSATASDADSGLRSVSIERRPVGAAEWQTLCSKDSSPLSCTWATDRGADGAYEVRAVALDRAGNPSPKAAGTTRVTIDNGPPTVTMAELTGPLGGSQTFGATASDTTSGVATVRIQYTVTGTDTWQDLCAATPAATGDSWSCAAETATIKDGFYDFRAVAVDLAGNLEASAPVADRAVDNTGPRVWLADPGAVLRASATLEATASSVVGVSRVEFFFAPAGTTAWTLLATDTTAPYSFSWDTTKVDDGVYAVRAVVVDGLGREAEAVRPGLRVGNPTLLRAVDVQTTNRAGGVNGDIEDGDALVLTYEGRIDLGRVLSGWTWSSPAANVTLSFVDVAEQESLTFGAGSALNLGRISFEGGEHLKKDKKMSVAGLLSATTETIGGKVYTRLTVDLVGVPDNSSVIERPTKAGMGTMRWIPCASGNDLLGGRCSTGELVEPGPADVDF